MNARYQMLGFQAAGDGMETAIAELDASGVPRSGVVPFFASDATNAQPMRLWDNVYLGDLLGINRWQQVFFAVLTAYYRHLEQHARAVSRSPLAACGGGVLGIECVDRVTVGAGDRQPWTRLTGERADQDALIVRYPEGPTLEVLASPRPGIRSITVRVASRARADGALRALRISVVTHASRRAFVSPGTQLTVALSSSRARCRYPSSHRCTAPIFATTQ